MGKIADESCFHQADRTFHITPYAVQREHAVGRFILLLVFDPVNASDQIVELILSEKQVFVIGDAEVFKKVDFRAEENCQFGKLFLCFADVAHIIRQFLICHTGDGMTPVDEWGMVGNSQNLNSLFYGFRAVVRNIAGRMFATVGVGVQIGPRYIIHCKTGSCFL